MLLRVVLLRVNLVTNVPVPEPGGGASNGVRGSLATAKCKKAVVAKYGPSIKVLFVPKDRVPSVVMFGLIGRKSGRIWQRYSRWGACGACTPNDLSRRAWAVREVSSAVKMKEHDA